jgi:hypothetical protein
MLPVPQTELAAESVESVTNHMRAESDCSGSREERNDEELEDGRALLARLKANARHNNCLLVVLHGYVRWRIEKLDQIYVNIIGM